MRLDVRPTSWAPRSALGVWRSGRGLALVCWDSHEEGDLGGQKAFARLLCASRCLGLEAPSYQYGGVPEGRPPRTAPRFLSEPSRRIKSDET